MTLKPYYKLPAALSQKKALHVYRRHWNRQDADTRHKGMSIIRQVVVEVVTVAFDVSQGQMALGLSLRFGKSRFFIQVTVQINS